MTATPKQELTAPPQAPQADEVELFTRDDEAPRDEEEEEDAAASRVGTEAPPAPRGARRPKGGGRPTTVRKLRQPAMRSKAGRARRAGVSPLTIDRVESGCPCRMDTKRKILEALGLSPSAREQVFGPDIDQG